MVAAWISALTGVGPAIASAARSAAATAPICRPRRPAATARRRSRTRTSRPVLRGPLHQLLDIERAQVIEEQKQADRHGGIADAGHDERFAAGAAVHRIAVPEADEQIAAQPDAFPSEVEEQEVVGQHQRQHRGHEQIHIGEEAAVAFVAAMNSAE